ncbi:trimeric intracellular cation channel family protein [Acidianus brierleyi]|uniref:Glycine transporter domain-containing protein n=2 Tax=Acidianus brierleyi TaxID=41673 RepID=A0A2U9IE23_9CREN|nr:trimeric intracellular cation channel family protein [Acidianus brierleyi]
MEVINYIGIFAFAASGALKAMEKQLDLLGAIVLGFVTSLAGGIIADILLGIFPPVNLVYLPYPITAIISVFLIILIRKNLTKISKKLLYFDAIGLGAFTAFGAQLAYFHNLNILGVAIVASITATGGGAIRDILVSEIPLILRKDFYATPSIIGGFVFYIVSLRFLDYISLILTFLLVTSIRLIAIKKKWELPKINII